MQHLVSSTLGNLVKTLFLRFLKLFYSIGGVMCIFLLAACSGTEGDSGADVEQTQSETATPEKSQTEEAEKPTSFDSYEDYIDYIADVPNFEPYYKTVFAFEELSNGVTDVPIEEVKAMYDEMKTAFDYVLVSENPLFYRGKYDGDPSFVDGYEEYLAADPKMKTQNPINMVSFDWEGKEIMTTPLKTVLLGESVFNRFDDSIEEGRNLQISDFTLKEPDEPISIVLGNAYKEIYKIGDIIPLELISEVMNFKVVGFYKANVGFSMDVGALHTMNFDHTIVMPYFIPEYEPVGEAAVFQHAFHIAELTSGYIKIPEKVEEINEDTFDDTEIKVEEIAERNDLSGFYKIPFWPVGFVWETDGIGY
ncbi:hypothetical protein [Lysinibacillus sp.]|uniref:hypothetical protein n=1 Tax=Lysinibacillus sp. TaxID=1869345 RepID=UPI0028A24B22|nr:hypothetical protein [Lysinibacillus sp.]